MQIGLVLILAVTAILCLPVFGQMAEKEWLEKGDASYNQSNYDDAIQAYDKAIKIDPNNAYAWYKIGRAHIGQGRYDAAVKCFDKAIRLDNNYTPAWNMKGYTLNIQCKYDEAINALDEAIISDHNYSAAWNNKGFALLQLARYDDSIEAFDEAIELDPNIANYRNNKGVALGFQGKYDDAVKCFDKAIRLDNITSIFRLNRYVLLGEQGNLSSALAIRGDPSYVLEIQANNDKIDPGDNLSLNLYVEGAGDVDYNKLRVNIPSYIVQKGTLEYEVSTFIFGNRLKYKHENDTLFLIIIPRIYFIGNESVNKILLNEDYPLSNTGGIVDNKGAPIIINFTVSREAPPGDHYINLNLFYKSNNKWFVDEQAMLIHINYWYEDRRLKWVAEFAVIIGILAGLITIIKEFWPVPWYRRS